MSHSDRHMAFDEAERFLQDNPDLEVIQVLAPDINGILRGKWVTPEGLAKLCKGQFKLPKTTLALDVWGNDVERLVFDYGDPDSYCLPKSGTLTRVPWAKRPTGQVLTGLHDEKSVLVDEEPQAILQHQLDRFAELGLTPVVATELEFYLLDKGQVANGRIPSPLTERQRQSGISGAQVYSLDLLDLFSDVIHGFRATCQAQKLPVDTLVKEAAFSQFEINLSHLPDALTAADQAILLKRAIKGTALQHDLVATFMSKPFTEHAGNGFHVHMSILNDKGHNIFDNGTDEGHENLRHAVAGMSATMADMMAIFAPNINSYRRFQPGAHAPLSPDWGYDNRTTSIRIPSGSTASRRIEHRVAGADANPYLVLAAILAGVHHGLTSKLAAPEPVVGSAYDQQGIHLPNTWVKAFGRFGASDFVKEYFGEAFMEYYLATKEQELAGLGLDVTSFEYDSYLKLI